MGCPPIIESSLQSHLGHIALNDRGPNLESGPTKTHIVPIMGSQMHAPPPTGEQGVGVAYHLGMGCPPIIESGLELYLEHIVLNDRGSKPTF